MHNINTDELSHIKLLIDLATALAAKQVKDGNKEKIMSRVQFLLAEQLVQHANNWRKLK